jgi:hypothetical protein
MLFGSDRIVGTWPFCNDDGLVQVGSPPKEKHSMQKEAMGKSLNNVNEKKGNAPILPTNLSET